MEINGKHCQTIWVNKETNQLIQVFDQRFFPHKISVYDCATSESIFFAIKEMVVRGAPLIGITAAYGMYLACLEAKNQPNQNQYIISIAEKLKSARPTAVNLSWAVNYMLKELDSETDINLKINKALLLATQLKNNDIAVCESMGNFGLEIIKKIAQTKTVSASGVNGAIVNILTHCNAGWLATVDWGTATAPIYKAFLAGIDVHVWVDETRPRNQGASLTAFELGQQGVKHTLITDNTGGHLMQHGMVDLVLVGTDRTTKNGDVANKIGTYLKALAAYDNQIPFYVAAPSSSIDFSISDGVKNIDIEKRDENEVKYVQGKLNNEIQSVLICPEKTPALNYGFDVTPARLITGIITERGICNASEEGLKTLFKEKYE
ncbi:MAG: S-methyl-5-thioribose-1-phosphate isomerase [Flavobacteriales bacterium CG18_big_fil_WC_8_21_14_2_50_32_9]|nr:MAG: S-methyl-5-thioribose-1-phosphate isomerase [Flavobacteriales bacterium CG18_big_fil_WC_8_21_14_2_50_32_9]PJC62024.1 MAG: S-methyl-5-thioribose-1-phosphate isomerase [Flavobacteriales bacterium CG_4_9_14_0_2_um_filter_32_27]